MNVSRTETAEYISSMCRQLSHQAKVVGMTTTAYLLDIAMMDSAAAVKEKKSLERQINIKG